MRIVSYQSADAPPKIAGLARIILPDHSFHPVVIHAPTEAEARARAQAWWDAQVAAEAAKKPRGRQRKAPVADAPVISDADAI